MIGLWEYLTDGGQADDVVWAGMAEHWVLNGQVAGPQVRAWIDAGQSQQGFEALGTLAGYGYGHLLPGSDQTIGEAESAPWALPFYGMQVSGSDGSGASLGGAWGMPSWTS